VRFERPITDPETISQSLISEVQTDVARGLMSVVQFSRPCYPTSSLIKLNELARTFGTGLQIRFFGHYDDGFDAATLRFLPEVRNLAVDCLRSIRNAEVIAELPSVEILSFEAFEFDAGDLTSFINLKNLKCLALRTNRKRNFDLQTLEQAIQLQELDIESHTKNLECLATLKRVARLTLRSCPAKASLAFVSEMDDLASLKLILGGRPDIADVESDTLQRLEIIRVKGLRTLEKLERFSSLRSIRVEDQIQLKSFDISTLSLRQIIIAKCKTLADLHGLDAQNELEEIFIAHTALPVDALLEQTWPPSLRCLGLFGYSNKWNAYARDRISQLGYSLYPVGWP
jgi:hypothetical protein